ncbi:MAG: hypothetical protein ABJC09_10040 [Terriglobia bacterium]
MLADQPIKTSCLPSFRAEHFPYSGPHPWLDCDDAAERLSAKVGSREISPAEADICRFWIANGDVILEGLFDFPTLDVVWEGYEKAVRTGRIQLPPEPAGGNDPWAGRSLNPHRKLSEFCRLLKHAQMMHFLRLLMGREPKVLQTIASHKGS